MSWRNLIIAAVITVMLVGLLACPGRTSISNITRDPARYSGRDVTVAGHVSDSFGALGAGVFQVDDGTGTIWVYSGSYGVPSNGAKVAVTGRIQQGFSFGGRSFATILRQSQPRH